MRSCDDCTKCCEGWLEGEVFGHKFYEGTPCHFMKKNGCSIYEKRPQKPCKEYSCAWLLNENIPEWLKPNFANVIITAKVIDNIEYYDVKEAGEKLKPEVLNWLFMNFIPAKINFKHNLDGGKYYFGSEEFVNRFRKNNV